MEKQKKEDKEEEQSSSSKSQAAVRIEELGEMEGASRENSRRKKGEKPEELMEGWTGTPFPMPLLM